MAVFLQFFYLRWVNNQTRENTTEWVVLPLVDVCSVHFIQLFSLSLFRLQKLQQLKKQQPKDDNPPPPQKKRN